MECTKCNEFFFNNSIEMLHLPEKEIRGRTGNMLFYTGRK